MYTIKTFEELKVGDQVIVVNPITKKPLIDSIQEIDKEERYFVLSKLGINIEMALVAVVNF